MHRTDKIIAAAGLSLGLLAGPLAADAADHSDSPAAMNDPAADITDLYAWMGGDTLNLVMNVTGAAMFSDAVQYVLHIDSGPSYGMTEASTTVLCRFDAEQQIECWLGDGADYAKGDASSEVGLTSWDGSFRVFAGERDDPFFFNLSGFSATLATVAGAAGGLTFDEAGCPALDMATSSALVQQLMTEPDGEAAVDDFSGNVLSIAIEIDRVAVTAGGPVIAVWGSTHR